MTINAHTLVRDWVIYKFTKFVAIISVFLVVLVARDQLMMDYIVEMLILVVVYVVAASNVKRIEDLIKLANIDLNKQSRKSKE
jgi:hypothetical protein